ncbi:hypothetical protein RB595_008822 [Gaeumannomyces hyphopodioides]
MAPGNPTMAEAKLLPPPASDSQGHAIPSSMDFINPDDPICVLLIGPSQNGKTTFVNRIIDLAAGQVERGKEGNKTGKCTQTTTVYDLDIQHSPYAIFDRHTGQEVPDITTDETNLIRNWRKGSKDYELRPLDRNAPYLKLRLIDTPGLDDSEGGDYQNMESILSTLNSMSQAEMPWKRKINALVLVYSSKNPFSSSFQTAVRNYHQCMPNLFSTMAFVNTHFDVNHLRQERDKLVRLKQFLDKPDESARRAIARSRADAFRELVGLGLEPTYFYVDNRPPRHNLWSELLSRNTIINFITYLTISQSSPMPIEQMRVSKSPDMEAVDARLQRFLAAAIERWSGEQKEALERVSATEVSENETLQLHENLDYSIKRCSEELKLLDNNTHFDLRPYMTHDDPNGWFLFFGGTILRMTTKNSMEITEPGFGPDEFFVDAVDGPTGKWGAHEWKDHPRTWVGKYEGSPGRAPRLLAKSYTFNRIKYKEKIADLKKQMWGNEARLEESKAIWNARRKQQTEVGDTMTTGSQTETEKLKALRSWIEAARNLQQVLDQKCPPIEKGFNEAARKRYQKTSDKIGIPDLYDCVGAANLNIDLLTPLKALSLDDGSS